MSSPTSTKKKEKKQKLTRKEKRLKRVKDFDNILENDRLRLQKYITDFIESSEHEIVLNMSTSKIERAYLHTFAHKYNLLTKSFGKEPNRIMRIKRRVPKKVVSGSHRVSLLPGSREFLNSISIVEDDMPSNEQIHSNTVQNIKQNSKWRLEALYLHMGQRLVPPRPHRISNELNREKMELPIFGYQDQILSMIQQHSIIIINGDTGSGKTTQVPQYILNEAARKNRPCRIVVSEPRRVACVSVAQRVAEERGEFLGDNVGYQIRMESRLRRTTNLIYTTSGCLLRSIMGDAKDLFRKVSHLIIDEIHERDKYTDFTLITIKEYLKKNKDLRVILMSATMDITSLSKYFDDCPILNVPGQGYDVKIYYLEDIVYHTGYRTNLMEKYLRMSESQPGNFNCNGFKNDQVLNEAARLTDEYLQEVVDGILQSLFEPMGRNENELEELFDQLHYYIESEGMSVDVGHSVTRVTPLIVACKCNMPKYVNLFVQHQAHVNICDGQGYTAADYSRLHSDGMCSYILQSSGAIFQQEIQYNQEDKQKLQIMKAYQQQFNDDNDVDHDLILSLVEGLYRSTHPGAIMVFLPGYNDILHQSELIKSTLVEHTYKMFILHGQMESKDQIEALKWQRVRKIILSTNIGQTSITIPDLAYVIDSGKVKMKAYDSVTESSQLQSMWISRADANQRSGRAGRTQNGVCYRLYSFAKYQSMTQFSSPEFMRIPLTEICLYAKALDNKCEVQTYLSKALNPPSKISVFHAIKRLQVLEVFNMDESITDLGKHLVDLPLDVQLGKCLLYSIYLKCFESILTIVAYHSVKDPYMLPTDRSLQGQASFLRKSFSKSTFSDQIGILEMFKEYICVRSSKKRAQKFCTKYFLSYNGMEMFCAARKQIADNVSYRFRINESDSMYAHDENVIRFCLTAGFYPNIAFINRACCKISSGVKNELILQRTSALNPPGMKNLKEFINDIPHEWIVYFEKTRLIAKCSINMNTVIPSIMILLQCGRDCVIDEDDTDESSFEDNELDDDEQYDDDIDGIENDLNTNSEIVDKLQVMIIADNGSKLRCKNKIGNTIVSLDDWIKFEINSPDAKLLLPFRKLIKLYFWKFLKIGQSQQTQNIADHLQKFLSCQYK